jgi:FkbM family methyltransferase
MLKYIKDSLKRKKARRVTKEYPAILKTFKLREEGEIKFAAWDNPLVLPGVVKQEAVDFFRKFISEGDSIIDIGANIGEVTVPMALAAGKSGLTLAFDPNPFVFKILENNASLNREKYNILPLPFAISVEEEEFYYVSSEASYGNGAISKTVDSNHGLYVYPEKIKGINLMQYLEKNQSERSNKLTFIKIDAEGYDKEIIKSINPLIENYRPTIVAECFGKNTDEEKIELFNVIEKNGYDIFYFEDFDIHGKVFKLNEARDILKWPDTINIYGTPRA